MQQTEHMNQLMKCSCGEKNKLIIELGNGWTPTPKPVYDVPSKVVELQKDSDSAHERFSVTQVKHFLRPEAAATSLMNTLHTSLNKFANPHEPPSNASSPIELIPSSYQQDKIGHKLIPDTLSSAKIIDKDVKKPSIHVTEVIDKDYSCATSSDMHEAKMKEVRDLLRRGTFRIILKEDFPHGTNALTARFVPAIKSNAHCEICCESKSIKIDYSNLIEFNIVLEL